MSTLYANRTVEPAFEPNGILLGGKVFAIDATILSGQNVGAGAVLGQQTTGGKWMLSVAAASDGSQTPKAVLAEGVNATAGDRPGILYLLGDFDATRLVFGAGHTIASTRVELAARGILLFSAQA